MQTRIHGVLESSPQTVPHVITRNKHRSVDRHQLQTSNKPKIWYPI